MELFLRPETLAVCRLPPDAPWPSPLIDGSLFSTTLTGSELSLVCQEDAAPAHARSESGWRALSVVGPLEFSMVGIIASLVTPLADAGVAVFVLSTFDTDHLLVKSEDLKRAIDVVRSHGHAVAMSPPI
jgi:hypothetical protein